MGGGASKGKPPKEADCIVIAVVPDSLSVHQGYSSPFMYGSGNAQYPKKGLAAVSAVSAASLLKSAKPSEVMLHTKALKQRTSSPAAGLRTTHGSIDSSPTLMSFGDARNKAHTPDSGDKKEEKERDPSLVLDLSRTRQYSLEPEWFDNKSHLMELDLTATRLSTMPPQISLLNKLEVLKLGENHIKELPPEIGALTELQVLDVNDNKLSTLPEALGALTNLESLLLFANQLASLPEALGKLEALTEINVFNNKILKFPTALGDLSTLEEVNVAGNKIMQVPAEAIASWEDVNILNMYENRILKLAPLSHMTGLAELRLYANNLSEMPVLGEKMGDLEILELQRNNIEHIPLEFFGSLASLHRLVLSGNKLKQLPTTIGDCSSLNCLVVDANVIEEVPKEVGKLRGLEILFVQGNLIHSLPSELKKLNNIQRANLQGNPISGSDDIQKALKASCISKKGGMYWGPDGEAERGPPLVGPRSR